MWKLSTLCAFALTASLAGAPAAQAEPPPKVELPSVDQRIIDQLIIDQLLTDRDMSGGDHVVGEELCARPAYRYERGSI